MKQYNIYKTMNLVNGKFYWGVHGSIDENDGYFGSGTVLRKAIKKHGKENFRRVTKLLYDTAKEAYKDEGFIVDKAMVENPMSYNMHPGGKGGSLPGIHSGMFGKHHSEESKRKSSVSNSITCSDGRRKGKNNPMFGKTGENNPNFGKEVSEETRAKLRKIDRTGQNVGEKNPMYGRKGEDNPNFGSKRSDETKAKMRIAQTGKNHPMFGRKGKDNPNYGKKYRKHGR